MAGISKIILPDKTQHDITPTAENIIGLIPVSKGGTGGETIVEARQNLGLGTGAILDIESISNLELEEMLN